MVGERHDLVAPTVQEGLSDGIDPGASRVANVRTVGHDGPMAEAVLAGIAAMVVKRVVGR
jgi:hypothetical protein